MGDGAADIKWQKDTMEEFLPPHEEFLEGRPQVKTLAFSIARRYGFRCYWSAMSCSVLLPRSEGTYKRCDVVGVRAWVKNGIAHNWSRMLGNLKMGPDEICTPAPTSSTGLENEGYLLTTRALMTLCCHWSRQLGSPEGRLAAHDLLCAIWRKSLGASFTLAVVANPSLPSASWKRVEVVVTCLEVNLDEVSLAFQHTQVVPASVRKAMMPPTGGLQPLALWLRHLMGRPTLHWLTAQLFTALASRFDDACMVEPDVLKPIRIHLADLGHRTDPAVRRAILEAARAKHLGTRMGRFAKAVGKAKLGANRNHLHVELKVYFMELRRCMQGAKQIAIAPDDTNFNGRSFCLSPVMNLGTGMVGWLPPKAWGLVKNILSEHVSCLHRACSYVVYISTDHWFIYT